MFDRTQAIEALEPFRQAARLPQNERQPDPLVEAGGLVIGKPTTDPGRLYIDAYVTFRANGQRIRILCYVKEQGDQPLFLLRINNTTEGAYNLAGLPAALERFQHYVDLAITPNAVVGLRSATRNYVRN
jgi:hypothetical protein